MQAELAIHPPWLRGSGTAQANVSPDKPSAALRSLLTLRQEEKTGQTISTGRT